MPERDRAYDVYLYDSFAEVPAKDFNASSAGAIRHWHVEAGHARRWSRAISSPSGATRIFRAVPANAP
jgi:hypothetical protein